MSNSTQKPTKQKINLDLVRTDGDTQPRRQMEAQAVYDYADAMKAKAKFPPITVYFDGDYYWLADGFHRVAAAKACKFKSILAMVHQGSKRDAILSSCGANDTNGLRRTRDDARRAITRLLKDEEWGQWSDSEIARRCKVHHSTVAGLRESLILSGEISKIERRKTERAGTAYTVNTANLATEVTSRKSETILDPALSWEENYSAMVAANQDKSVFIAPGEKSTHWIAFGATAAQLAETIGKKPAHRIAINNGQVDYIAFKVGSPLDANRLERLESLIGSTTFYLETDPVLLDALFRGTLFIEDPNILVREKEERERLSRQMAKLDEEIVAREREQSEAETEPVIVQSSDNSAFPKPGLPAQVQLVSSNGTHSEPPAPLSIFEIPIIESEHQGLELLDQVISVAMNIARQIHDLDDEHAQHVGGFLGRIGSNLLVPYQANTRKLLNRPVDMVRVLPEIHETQNEFQLRKVSEKVSGMRAGDEWLDRELGELFAAVVAQREKIKAAA